MGDDVNICIILLEFGVYIYYIAYTSDVGIYIIFAGLSCSAIIFPEHMHINR